MLRKKPRELIEGTIKRTENGTKIARETAEALNKIVEGISRLLRWLMI